MPRLDGLRALAVLGVFIQHALPSASVVQRVGAGYYGVTLFFVLSGFLITRILIACGTDAPPLATVRRFYARRALRIMPVFYLTLLTAALLDVPPVRATFWWHATYLSNAYFALRGDWDGTVSPFWTLAIEEQFYLAWPWVVLATPRTQLTALLVALIGVCPVVRALYAAVGVTPFAIGFLPFGKTDFLLIGALLADLEARGAAGVAWRRRLGRCGVVVGVPVYLLSLRGWWAAGVVANAALGFFLFWVVDRAAVDRGGRMLAAWPLRALGTISYGMYVYQTFVMAFVAWVATRVGDGHARYLPHGDFGWLPLRFIAVVLVAAGSWRWFERPILQRARRVPYVA
jgi:peptidoglycan/LPS O-acetylase OafA/YrhL